MTHYEDFREELMKDPEFRVAYGENVFQKGPNMSQPFEKQDFREISFPIYKKQKQKVEKY